MNLYQQQAVSFNNDLRRSCGALIGIIQGMLSDGHLHDREIAFLLDWLDANEAAASTFPGSALLPQIQTIVADGCITDAERHHLTHVLQQIVGGTLEDLAQSTHVCALALDTVPVIDFTGRRFCLTGDFVFGPRDVCASAITRRGGEVLPGVTKKLSYLVVGGLGSPEWKHGSFGTKIEKALQYRAAGVPLLVIHEDLWAGSLTSSMSA
jgi:NAD-dependent DNA ligase